MFLDTTAFSDLRQASPDHFPPKHLKRNKQWQNHNWNKICSKPRENKERLTRKKCNAKSEELSMEDLFNARKGKYETRVYFLK